MYLPQNILDFTSIWVHHRITAAPMSPQPYPRSKASAATDSTCRICSWNSQAPGSLAALQSSLSISCCPGPPLQRALSNLQSYSRRVLRLLFSATDPVVPCLVAAIPRPPVVSPCLRSKWARYLSVRSKRAGLWDVWRSWIISCHGPNRHPSRICASIQAPLLRIVADALLNSASSS
ncbi:hypothetical protein BD309DRAFT_962674 [Dichomitus squalens]|nr:hypothetical protein BD309DRAFT_962674 [Dichomitus squalens]